MKTLTAKADAKNVLGVFYFSFKWVVPYRSLLNPPLPPFSPGLPSLLCTSLPLRLFPYLLDYFIFIITSPLRKTKAAPCKIFLDYRVMREKQPRSLALNLVLPAVAEQLNGGSELQGDAR